MIIVELRGGPADNCKVELAADRNQDRITFPFGHGTYIRSDKVNEAGEPIFVLAGEKAG